MLPILEYANVACVPTVELFNVSNRVAAPPPEKAATVWVTPAVKVIVVAPVAL
jgi:hypothetical protein